MGKIKEEKIKCDLGGQGEILRRLCLWLQLWADLEREHFTLSTVIEIGTQMSLQGNDEKTDGAREQDVVGDSYNGNFGSDYGGKLMLFSDY